MFKNCNFRVFVLFLKFDVNFQGKNVAGQIVNKPAWSLLWCSKSADFEGLVEFSYILQRDVWLSTRKR
jgi:hypothetical protein